MAWSRLTEGIYFLDYISESTSNSKHTYKGWGLIMESDDVGFPELLNNDIDSYLSLQGQPSVDVNTLKYGRRKMVFSFGKKVTSRWPALVATITEAIHGKKKVILRDCEPNYVYIGRCYVRAYKTTRGIGKIQIEVDAEPYKIAKSATTVDFTSSPSSFTYDFDGKYETPVDIGMYFEHGYSNTFFLTCRKNNANGIILYEIIGNVTTSDYNPWISGVDKKVTFTGTYTVKYRFPVLFPGVRHHFTIDNAVPYKTSLYFRNIKI